VLWTGSDVEPKRCTIPQWRDVIEENNEKRLFDISCNSFPVPNIPRPYRDKKHFSFHILFKSPPIINLSSDGTVPERVTAPCNRRAVCPLTPAVWLAQERGAVAIMRSALFWVVTRRVVVNPHRYFGTTYRLHLQGSRNIKSSSDLIYKVVQIWPGLICV